MSSPVDLTADTIDLADLTDLVPCASCDDESGDEAHEAMQRHIRNSLDLTLTEADNEPSDRWWADTPTDHAE